MKTSILLKEGRYFFADSSNQINKITYHLGHLTESCICDLSTLDHLLLTTKSIEAPKENRSNTFLYTDYVACLHS